MQLNDYIRPELLVLVPVLYLVGMGAKKSRRIDDRNIPALLGLVGIVLATVVATAAGFDQLALVGDQLFTDRLAGWNYGIPVLVVQPLAPDTHRGIRFRRHLEQPFIRRYFKKGGQLL